MTGSPNGMLVVTAKRVRKFKVKRDMHTVKLSKASSASPHGTLIKT